MLKYFTNLITRMNQSVVWVSKGQAIKEMPILKSPEQYAIELEADNLLFIGSYNLFFELVGHGYQITDGQKKVLNEKVKSYLNSNYILREEDTKKLNDLLLCGYELTNDELAMVMFNSYFMIYCKRELIKKEPHIDYQAKDKSKSFYWAEASKQVLAALGKPEMIEFFYQVWMKKLEGYKNGAYFSDTEINYPWDVMKEYWAELITPSEYKKIMTALNHKEDKIGYAKNLIVSLETLFKDRVAIEKNDLISRTQKVYSSQGIGSSNAAKVEERAKVNLAAKFKTKKLGASADTLVMEIETSLQKININDLNPQDAFTVKNIIDLVLPETIAKYLSIDEAYRVDMRNRDGKNAYDLLLESLGNIKATLTGMVEMKNQSNFEKMDAQVIYTRTLKHSH